MSKVICNRCEREMKPLQTGVYVVEMASFGPYKIWQADKKECPECGQTVTTGFGYDAIATHHEQGFKEFLDSLKEYTVIKSV